MNLQFKIAHAIGTVFYIGKLPIAPGTWGSLAALISWFIIKPKISDPLFLLITGGIFFIGIASSEIIINNIGKKDPKEIVIDEWVGMWISLYLVQHDIIWGIVTFLFFRLFDIFKPGPIYAMDQMEGGIGVMMDDVVAGIITCLLMQSLTQFTL